MVGEIATAYVQLEARGGAALSSSVNRAMPRSSFTSAGQQGGDAYMSGMSDGVGRKKGLLSGALGGAMKLGAGAALGGGLVVAAGLKGAITSAMDFDLVIRQIGVSTGASGAKLDDLREYALKMGADTSFSAREAGDAMLELGKSGLTAAEIKGGALATTLDLAAAGQLGLADAAGFVTASMGQFGLSAEDASKASAALAGAANASKADVGDVGMALAQVGTVANTTGFTVDETTAAIAAMSKAGIEGSDAGTSLKTMFSNLVPATESASSTFEQYGINMVKRNGDFKDMAEVAEELQTGLAGLSESDTQQALKEMFGSDAVRAGIVMMQQGGEGIEKLNDATKDSTALQDMAKTATEGAKGALDQFMGSVETVGIRIGDKLLPAFTNIVEGGTDIINGLGDVFSGKGIPGMGGGGNSALGDGLDLLSHHTQNVLDVGKEVWKGLEAGWSELTDSVGDIMDKHGPMIHKITEYMGDASDAARDVLGPSLKWLADHGLDAVGEGFEHMFNMIQLGGNVFFDLSQFALTMAGTIVETMTDATANILDMFTQVALAGARIGIPGMEDVAIDIHTARMAIEGFGDDFKAGTKIMVGNLQEQQWEWNLTAQEAEKLGNRIRMLPDEVETYVKTPGLLDSWEKVQLLRKSFDLTPEEVLTVVRASGTVLTTAQIRKLNRQVELTPKEIALLVRQSGGVKTVGDIRKVLNIADATDKKDIAPILKVLGVDVSVRDFMKVKDKGLDLDKLRPTPRVNVETGDSFGILSRFRQALTDLDGDTAHTYVITHHSGGSQGDGSGVKPAPNTRSLTTTPTAGATGFTPTRGHGRMSLVEGRLSIDESGDAWIRGVAREEIDDANGFSGTLARMRG